jgi:aspartate kinase
MARTVVQKFGGSSVADAERLGRVADRVAQAARAGDRVVVVVSAMGKTTDQLLALARTVAESPSRRELDMLLSTGERVTMALLAMALEARGLQAISFTGSQSGILTNDRHSGARIIEVRPVRIEDELDRGRVVIVAGFQGMSYRREITTLGRGGSDTTAVALAAALGADCEIYSDVDGVYSADPRVVPEARRLDRLGYEEMQELAEHGAKVLNAQAVEWARKAGIVIYARASNGQGGETRVGPAGDDPRVGGPRALAVAAQREVVRLCGPDLIALCAEERLALRRATPERAWLVRDDVPDWPRVQARLAAGAIAAETFGSVSLVGPGVGGDPVAVRRALTAAAPVADWDASPLRLTVYVEPARTDDVTRALHATFL